MILKGRYTGTVNGYDVKKGWGHITVDGEKDHAFIHYKEILTLTDTGTKKLQTGQKVEFDLYRREKGLLATQLSIVGHLFDEGGDLSGNN